MNMDGIWLGCIWDSVLGDVSGKTNKNESVELLACSGPIHNLATIFQVRLPRCYLFMLQNHA